MRVLTIMMSLLAAHAPPPPDWQPLFGASPQGIAQYDRSSVRAHGARRALTIRALRYQAPAAEAYEITTQIEIDCERRAFSVVPEAGRTRSGRVAFNREFGGPRAWLPPPPTNEIGRLIGELCAPAGQPESAVEPDSRR